MPPARKQHMQAPKNFPATQDIHQSSSYGNSKENPTGSVRLTDFCMGVCFPFVSDMRHRLLNLSSVRHSITSSLQTGILCGWGLPHHTQKGDIICKRTLVLSDSRRLLALGCWGKVSVVCVLLLNKTCPSHHNTPHKPPLPRASTTGTLAITIEEKAWVNFVFVQNWEALPAPHPFNKTPNKKQQNYF